MKCRFKLPLEITVSERYSIVESGMCCQLWCSKTDNICLLYWIVDIDKQENGKEIFQAYETRFRMPHVHPPELGVYDGPPGFLNMDVPPYPLPYEWGNAYYVFDYGPAKHIVHS